MTTKLYITKEYLYPLQMKIYEIIVQSNLSTMTESGSTDMVVRATWCSAGNNCHYNDTNFNHLSITTKHFIGGMMGCSKKKVGNNMKKF